MSQQQQSNPIAPQKIGAKRKPLKEQPVGGMDGLYPSEMKAKKMVKAPAKPKQPSMTKVQKSVRKTMGY